MDQVRIVGMGGSLAAHSTSLAALRLALEGAEGAGAVTDLFDVAQVDLPLYDPGGRSVPIDAQRLADAAYGAHGLIWSSPLYHGTVSGAFKNMLDWLQLLADRDPPFLSDKVVGLISTAGGVFGLQAVNTLEFVVRALRAWAVPLVVPVARAYQAFDDQGRPRDSRVADQLRALGAEVVRGARHFADAGQWDYARLGPE
jgi:FMN reductase